MILFNQSNLFINMFATYGPYIVGYKQIYRLITGAFLHGNIFHLLFNCYALYVIGSQIESFFGKVKYLVIYFFSILTASLLSITLNNAASIGASGAVFGLMGALLCFGYYYRAYIGTVVRSQIIPIIILNLMIGFIFGSHIDNFAHIGGLIGGILITSAVGVKYKSSKSDIINGIILSILFVLGLFIFAFKFVG